jgi:hypothetical protein
LLLFFVVDCCVLPQKQLKIIKKAIKQPPHTKNTTRPEVKKDPHPLDCCVRVVVVVCFCCRLLFSLDCCVLPQQSAENLKKRKKKTPMTKNIIRPTNYTHQTPPTPVEVK